MNEDAIAGVDKDHYSLGTLDTIPVEVDITKEDILRKSDYHYEIKK